MTKDEVLGMTNEELQINVAKLLGAKDIKFVSDFPVGYWPENDEGRGEGWEEIPDYPDDIAQAWELFERAREGTYFGDFCQALKAIAESDDLTVVMGSLDADTITRAFVMAMTQKEGEDDAKAV